MPMLWSSFRNRLGFVFFFAAGLLAFFSDWQRPNLLVWISAFHNLMLAFLYISRKSENRYDRTGLWLGLMAAFLPIPFSPENPGVLAYLVGLTGYGLIFWSLLALGPSFGIAPADRGLVSVGPYVFVRHPMYLGELLLRAALMLGAGTLSGLVPFTILAFIQLIRIQREEKIIQGYEFYARQVPWRLIPLVY